MMMTPGYFEGVVEDIHDPQENGRVRVRAVGYHSDSTADIPHSSLPWATVVLPTTSASISGIGQNHGLLPGSWVVGYFRDGEDAQDPVITGSIPGRSTKVAPGSGFSDPSGLYPLYSGNDSPVPSGSGFRSSLAHSLKTNLMVTEIGQATKPQLTTLQPNEQAEERTSWGVPDPKTTNAPAYPYNKVNQTPSGHIFEVDDTPGFERISEFHASGSYRETSADGSLVQSIVGDRYTIIAKDDKVYIKGNCSLTIEGDVRQLVKGNYILEVDGDYTELIKGSKKSKVGGSVQSEIGQELAQNIGEDSSSTIGGDSITNVSGSSKNVTAGNYVLSISGDYTNVTVGDFKDVSGGSFTVGSGASYKCVSADDASIDTGGSYKCTASADSTTEAGGAFMAKAASTANLEGGGITSVKGSIINLN